MISDILKFKFGDWGFNKLNIINIKINLGVPEILIFTLTDKEYRGYLTPDGIELKKYNDESYIKNSKNSKYDLFAEGK